MKFIYTACYVTCNCVLITRNNSYIISNDIDNDFKSDFKIYIGVGAIHCRVEGGSHLG